MLDQTLSDHRWLPWFEPEADESADVNRPTPQREINSFPIFTLACPDQTEVVQGIKQTQNRNFTATVYINTSLSGVALANHYQTEMQEAGWEQQAKSQKGDYHLSLWSLTDEQGQSWEGFLNLLAGLERTNQYIGFLTIKLLN